MTKYRIHNASIFENRHLFNLSSKFSISVIMYIHIYDVGIYFAYFMIVCSHKNIEQGVLYVYRIINTETLVEISSAFGKKL